MENVTNYKLLETLKTRLKAQKVEHSYSNNGIGNTLRITWGFAPHENVIIIEYMVHSKLGISVFGINRNSTEMNGILSVDLMETLQTLTYYEDVKSVIKDLSNGVVE